MEVFLDVSLIFSTYVPALRKGHDPKEGQRSLAGVDRKIKLTSTPYNNQP